MPETDAQNSEPGAEQRGLKQALEQLNERVSELCAYARHLGRAQVDALEVRIRRTAIKLVLGFFGVLGFTALTFVLLFYCIHASARGFAAWASWPVWAGQLLIGSCCLLAIVLAAVIAYTRVQRQRVERKRAAYAARREKQQARYERNVHDIGNIPAARATV
jgi:hypothetical protein